MKLFLPLLIIFFLSTQQNSTAQCNSTNALLFQDFEGYSVSNPPPGWITKNVDYDAFGTFLAYSGTKRLGMNDVNDSIITPLVSCPNQINFYWRASGASSSWVVQIQYSTDLANWTTIDNITTTGSGSPITYQLKTIAFPNNILTPPFGVYIRWNMTSRVSGTFYLDDVCMLQGVCHAVATQLRFTQYTSNCVPSGIPFSAQVCATDNNGFTDTTFTNTITLSTSSPGTLGGTLSVNAVAGCATFNNVTYSSVSPLSITAQSGSFTSPVPLTGLNIQTTCPNVDTLKVVTYNLLNFPLGGVYALGGACTLQESGPNRWDTLKYIMEYMQPDILIVQELQTELGADMVLSNALNVNGVTHYARAPYIPNRSTANTKYNNELFYNTDKLTLYNTTTIGTSIRDCGVYTLYCKDPQLNAHHDTTFIDMYCMHTKAKGLGAAQATLDSIQRAADCQKVMDTIRLRQATNRNAILGGDLNLYSSNEGAFQNLTTGLYKFNDPINAPGAWESNAAFAYTHTQAARSGSLQSLECGATGGLDSRLDFLLATDDIMNDAKHMKYIPNSYKPFGNSGNLFNKSVNDPTNLSGVPFTVLNRLINMSDHVPVELKVAVKYPNAVLSLLDEIVLKGNVVNDNIFLNWEYKTTKKIVSLALYANNKIVYTQKDGFNQRYFTLKNIANGYYQFRIQAQLQDGEIVYSNTIALLQKNNIELTASPNPFLDVIKINGFTQKNTPVSIKITDTKGIVVHKQFFAKPLDGFIDLKTVQLSKGFYFIYILQDNRTQVLKVIKQ